MAATGDRVTYYGHGHIMDSTNNSAKLGFNDFKLTCAQEFIELAGNSVLTPDSFKVAGKKEITCSYSFERIDAATIALMFGGSTTASSAVEFIAKETVTVPSAPGPYTVVLSETPDAAGAVQVFAEASSGVRTELEQVTAASEVAGASYSISGATLTFAAGDADVVYEADYYAATTNGSLITIEPGDMPGNYTLYAIIEAASYDLEDRQIVIKIANFVPQLPSSFGASTGQPGDPITIEGGVTGDLIISIRD